MQYFIDNRERMALGGTSYLEFQKGVQDGLWLEDSLYIDWMTFKELGLNKIFLQVVEDFDYYDDTVISESEWNQIYDLAISLDGNMENILAGLKAWAEACFSEANVMMLKGV